MTLSALTAETAFGFYYWFEPNYFRKYANDVREIFRIGSLMGVSMVIVGPLRAI